MKMFYRVLPFIAAAALGACRTDSLLPPATTGMQHVGGRANSVSGSIRTTFVPPATCNAGSITNCNSYNAKTDVMLTGGPQNLEAGTYFFKVTTPNGGTILSSDAVTERVFTVDTNGLFTYDGSTHTVLLYNGQNVIGLAPFDNTTNNGGVYKAWVCAYDPQTSDDTQTTDCKTDNFKVAGTECVGDGCVINSAQILAIDKTAAGAYTDTWTWGIAKTVDKTYVRQIGGSVTFNYTVTVTRSGPVASGIGASGVITVNNPNADGVQIDSITDVLSNNTVCTVTNGGAQTLAPGDNQFNYSCTLSSVPTVAINNTATVYWPEQILDEGELTAASNNVVVSVPFTETKVNDQVTVTDVWNGGAPVTLGTMNSTDTNPKAFTYSKVVNVVNGSCITRSNTSTYTTNTTSSTGTSGQTVTVCGGDLGGLTIGYWQNKNGQAQIKGVASTAGVCNLTPALRAYAPFQDLSATASCTAVASYVNTIVTAANASGASMNAMLKAQMLATALSVYFTSSLGTTKIDLTAICRPGATCNSTTWQNVSLAFGGATALTVNQILAYAASQSNAGGTAWYGQVKSTQELAKNTFDAINNDIAFVAP